MLKLSNKNRFKAVTASAFVNSAAGKCQNCLMLKIRQNAVNAMTANAIAARMWRCFNDMRSNFRISAMPGGRLQKDEYIPCISPAGIQCIRFPFFVYHNSAG